MEMETRKATRGSEKRGPDIEVQAGSFEDGKAQGMDEAFRALATHSAVNLTPERNRALLRKIDLNLMPVSYPISPRKRTI